MRSVRSAIAALVSASLALGGPTLAWANAPARNKAAEIKPSGLRALGVKVGQAKDLTHIEFPGSDPVATRKDGNDLVLRFARAVSPDLVQLKVMPPHFTKAAVITPSASGVELRLSPADGATLRLGKADGVTFVNFAPAPDAGSAEPPAPKDQTPTRHADPVPSSGVVRMQPELQGKALVLKFPWRAPLGAAVFRRGDAIWMVFDAKATLDVSAAPHGLVQLRKVEAVNGKDYSAVRVTAPANILASANAQGATWTLTLGPAMTAAEGVTLARDDANGPATLTAQMAGSTGVFWVDDPAVGDRLAVVTALAPAKGLDTRRQMVDAIILPSVQGLAIQPLTDDLAVSADGDLVRIGRPKGLALSPASAPMRHVASAASAAVDIPSAAALPGLVDFTNWPKTGEGGFVKRYGELMDAAAEEGGKGKAAGVQARLGLVRFQVASGLAFEAIGTLNLLARTNPAMLGDAEFRGLRGAARVMAGRYHDAQADFSSPSVADDPASALWRGYAAAKLGDNSGAREQFGRGRSAINQFSGEWKARFARVDAEAAMALGDVGTARGELNLAAGEKVGGDEADSIRLAQGRLAEAQNLTDEALALYDEASRSHYGAVAAPALLRATELKLAKGKMSVSDAAAQLDSLRYRWRGDGVELETVRSLGHLYLGQGRYREALYALRSAGTRQPDQPVSLAISNDISTAFRSLFLDGQADGLQPLQALGLFFDFKEFVPIGADGELMLRKMVRRLVDVDLLDQAADLLKYQVDTRLNGVAKAQVSTDLATIYLMDKKPEQALEAINNSRSTLLPTALNAQRRVVEARALLSLGRADHALELLEGDKSAEAGDVRTQAAWSQHAWPQAGAQLEGQLGDRWKRPGPLTGEEQGRLMRAGTAYSLAGDDASLTRLRTRYGKLAEASGASDGLRVALAGVQENTLNTTDFAKASSDTAAFAGWVSAMKKRFHDQLGAPPPSAPAQPKLTKAAAPAPVSKPSVKPALKKG